MDGAVIITKDRIKTLSRMVQLATTREAVHYKQDYCRFIIGPKPLPGITVPDLLEQKTGRATTTTANYNK